MESKEGGVCYQNGEVVQNNYQMCSVVNERILSMLQGRIPQATFSCGKDSAVCDFQCMWICRAFCPKLPRRDMR